MADAERLKLSWAHVAAYGDQVPLRFYSRLFVTAPETRGLFPLGMAAQRDRLVTALARAVAHVDDLDHLRPHLQQLGRDHRRFGVEAEHYGPVGEALLATLADFLGHEWTAELAQDWAEAYGLVATTMIDAAALAARSTPRWWAAEVVAHERRTFDVAVLTVRPDQPYHYLPGQSLTVETAFRPRLWRYYSPANAPRADGSIDLHVRRVPGGHVSAALVDRVGKGDVVHLGAPVGYRLTLPPDRREDLLLIAGGTGLAPLKALVEQVAAAVGSTVPVRRVALFFGTRTPRELYELEALLALEAEHRWLTVGVAVTDDPLRSAGLPRPPGGPSRADIDQGPVGEVALRYDRWHDRLVYVCGSEAMVRTTVQLIRASGCAAADIRYEGFQGLGGETFGVLDPGGGHQ